MAGSMRIIWDSGKLNSNLDALPGAVDKLISKTIDFHAARGESIMKTQAPWTDRTVNARNSLHTKTVHDKTHHELILAHGMRYGFWLEVRWAGKWGIVLPTLLPLGKDVMGTLNRGLGRIGGSL